MLLSEGDIEAHFLCLNSDKYIEVNMDKSAVRMQNLSALTEYLMIENILDFCNIIMFCIDLYISFICLSLCGMHLLCHYDQQV